MTIDELIKVLVTVTLVEMMVAIGLGATFADLAGVARNWRLVVRAGVANYLCVPAVTVGLLFLFRSDPLVAAGFLILAVCPGAPYGPPLTAVARGNVPLAVGLMVILAGSSALVAPVLFQVLLPLLSESEGMQVDAIQLVGTLLVTQLVPLCVGLAVRWRRPELADRLQKPANLVGKVLNGLVVGAILVAQFRLLTAIRPLAYVGMLALALASLAVGWLLGGPVRDGRKTVALTTAVRNAGLGLVIATGSFPGTPAVTAATAYALFQTVVVAVVAVGWGRLRFATAGGATPRDSPTGAVAEGAVS